MRRLAIDRVGGGSFLFAQAACKNAVSVGHVHHPALLPQGTDPRSHSAHDGLRRGIEEVENKRAIGEREVRHVLTHGFYLWALLFFTSKVGDVTKRCLVEFRCVLHANDSRKRTLRGEKQRAAFSTAEINKCVTPVVNRQSANRFAQQFRRNRPVARAVSPVRTIDAQIALVDALRGFDVVFQVEGVNSASRVQRSRLLSFSKQAKWGSRRKPQRPNYAMIFNRLSESGNDGSIQGRHGAKA